MAAGRHGSIDVVGAPGRLLNLPGLLRLLCRLSLLGNLLDDGTAVVGVRLPDAGLLPIDGAGHGFSGQAWDRAMGGTAAYLQRIGVLGG